MALDRRDVLRGSALLVGAGAALVASEASAAGPKSREKQGTPEAAPGAEAGAGARKTSVSDLQSAIDRAAATGEPLNLEPRTYRTGALTLRKGVVISGVPGRTVLEMTGQGGALLIASTADSITLRDLILDGNRLALDANIATGLVMATQCRSLRLENLTVRNSLLNGITLEQCSGTVTNSIVEHVSMTASSAGTPKASRSRTVMYGPPATTAFRCGGHHPAPMAPS